MSLRLKGCASLSSGYKHVGLDERVEIEKLVDRGWSIRRIAVSLGRSPSTVSREIRRRSWRASNTAAAYTPYRPAALRTGEVTKLQYRATIAQAHAQRMSARSHQPVRMRSDRLVAWVCQRLQRGWTPQEISGRLYVEFPGDMVMRVSTETLYAWIYAPAQASRKWWQYLPRGHRKRRRATGRRVHRTPAIKYRVSIHDRPQIINERVEFGHWEADTVLGVRGSGNLHTEVERVSRFLIAVRVPSGAAIHTVDAQITMFARLPAHAVRSVTCDNGTEFALHYRLAERLCVPTYFADPYSAWQRGSNEHFNGRIRKYLPKRTRLDTIDDTELADIITEINNRPRKILGWQTPAEVFNQLSSTQPHRCTSV